MLLRYLRLEIFLIFSWDWGFWDSFSYKNFSYKNSLFYLSQFLIYLELQTRDFCTLTCKFRILNSNSDVYSIIVTLVGYIKTYKRVRVHHNLKLRKKLRSILWHTPQKQPFAEVLQNRCSWKFLNIHRKTTVLESQHRCCPANIAKILKTLFFTEHRRWVLLTCPRHNFSVGSIIHQNNWQNTP